MKSLVKWLAILLGIVVVVVIAAALLLPSIISTDAITARVIAAVKSATGRDLKIAGPVKFSVLPHLAIEADQVALSNVPGAQNPVMVQLDQLQIELELIPILTGTIAVDRFVLQKPVIALEVDKQGKPNWAFTPAGGATTPSNAPEAPSGAPSGGLSLPAGLTLGDVRLVEGSITYANDQTGAKTSIDAIDVSLSLRDFDSPFSLSGSAAYRGQTIKLKVDADKPRDLTEKQGTKLQASVASDLINLDFNGSAALVTPIIAGGDVDLSIPSMRKLAAWVGVTMAQGGEGFGPLSIKGKLGMKGDEIQFDNAQIALDSIKGTGQIAVVTGGVRPDLRGNLALDSLDLNPYLPPEAKGETSAGNTGGSGGAANGGWSDAPIDVSGLKAADVDFKLSANAIALRKIKIDRSALALHLKDGKLTADLSDFDAYQGKGTANVAVDGSGAEPTLSITGNFANVALEPILHDTIDLDRVDGKGNLDLAVTGHGRSQRAIISALNGKGSLHFTDGEIKGLDLLKLLNAASTNVADLLTGAGGGNTTKFTKMSGTYTITNGILTNSDLALEGPGLKAAGAGTVDLPQRRVDYKVTPQVVGLGVPVIISGPWDNLSYRPDLAGIVKGGVGGAVNTLKGAIPGMNGNTSSTGNVNPLGGLKGLFGK